MKKVHRASLLFCIAITLIACANSSESQVRDVEFAAPGDAAQAPASLAPNINPFRPADKGDRLDKSMIRLARTAMDVDLDSNEPWLYDRATTYYKLALWSGDQDFRTHAFSLVEKYYGLITPEGRFSLKPSDVKYAYVDGAVWYEHETGDARFRPQAEAIYNWWTTEFPLRYSPAQHFWTERNIAYALGAAIGWYELSGDDEAIARARDIVSQWQSMSEGSGAPLHSLAQHQEEFEPPWADRQMTSPWMAAVFFEYLQQYERLTGDDRASRIVSDYADFLLDNCLYDGSVNHPNLRGYLMPYYLCGPSASFYSRETPSEGDGEHTPDVMGIFAYAVWAKRNLGLDPKPALAAYEGLRHSAGYFVSRRQDVNPPRKISWWFGSSYDSTYLVKPPK